MITNEQMEAEKNNLKNTYSVICKEIDKSTDILKTAEKTLIEQYKYKDEDYHSMDEEEVASEDLLCKNLEDIIDVSNQKLKILNNLKKSCYFGKVIFNSSDGFNKIYVGVNSLLGEGNFPLICDWRSPVSTLFYNNELGQASYKVNDLEIKGEIIEKRQLKVKQDELVYAFDSDITISDQILKDELGKAKSNKMTNIVATIQKEQNEIIRNPNLNSVIIQGVAGSGKTSIALHRAAYILYSFRNQIKAENILIFSPAEIFSSYIENVLPELGENMVKSTTVTNLAKEELSGYIFETASNFFERIYGDKSLIADYNYRSGFEYVKDIKDFLNSNNFFEAYDLKLGSEVIPSSYINELYQKFSFQKPCFRISNIVQSIMSEFNIPSPAGPRFYNQIFSMYKFKNIYEILIEFEKNNKKINNKIKYEENNKKITLNYDLIPIILYLADYFYGLEKREEIKFLIIDEFQEFPVILFELFKNIFDAHMLICGDIYQNVYKNLNEQYVKFLSEYLSISDVVYLTKSYRMTNQIFEYAKKFRNVQMSSYDRDGREINYIQQSDLISYLKNIKDSSSAIIFNDYKSAEEFYNANKNLLSCSLNQFEEGRLLIADYNSVKGLEFEEVIVPKTKASENDIDKNIMFNICTRATNLLTIVK